MLDKYLEKLLEIILIYPVIVLAAFMGFVYASIMLVFDTFKLTLKYMKTLLIYKVFKK